MGVDECAVLRSGRSVDAEAIAKCIETMPGAGELLRGFFQCVDARIFRPDVIGEVAFIAKEADVVSSVIARKRVVWGKSASVRVHLGGSGRMNNNKSERNDIM